MRRPVIDSERAAKMRAKRTALEISSKWAEAVAENSDAEDFLHAYRNADGAIRTKCASLLLGPADEAEVVCLFVKRVASLSGIRGFFAMRRGKH